MLGHQLQIGCARAVVHDGEAVAGGVAPVEQRLGEGRREDVVGHRHQADVRHVHQRRQARAGRRVGAIADHGREVPRPGWSRGLEHAGHVQALAAVLEEAANGVGEPPVRRDERRVIDEPAEHLVELRPARDQRGRGRALFGHSNEAGNAGGHARDRPRSAADLLDVDAWAEVVGHNRHRRPARVGPRPRTWRKPPDARCVQSADAGRPAAHRAAPASDIAARGGTGRVMTNLPRRTRVESICDGALNLAPHARDAYVRDACGCR